MVKIVHHGNSICIMPREGSFPGMPAERAYTVEFLAVQQPASVSVNGATLSNGSWNYDAQQKKVNVYVPSMPCDKKIDVSVNY